MVNNTNLELEFVTSNIWDSIKLISESPLPKKVASAYLGGSVNFDWKHGDVLLLGLNENNVKDRLIDLDLLQKIMQIGVTVYKRENLHAKVYYNSKMSVICSCNLSAASQKTWLEAGIVTSNYDILQSVERFFEEYTSDDKKVTEEDIISLKLIAASPSEEQVPIRNSPYSERLWVVETIPSEKEDPITEQILAQKGREAKQMVDENKVALYSLKINTPTFSEIKTGDLLIRLSKEQSEEFLVFPIYKCIKVSRIPNERLYCNFVHQKGMAAKKWNEIRTHFEGIDLTAFQGEIIDEKEELIRKMFLLFSF